AISCAIRPRADGGGAGAGGDGAGHSRTCRPIDRDPKAKTPERLRPGSTDPVKFFPIPGPTKPSNQRTNSRVNRGIINSVMTLKLNGFWSSVLWISAVSGLVAQTPSQSAGSQKPAGQAAPTQAVQQSPTFKVQIDAVSMDVIVKDDQGRFIPDLKKDEFEIYEDGVKQEIASMTMSHGGRVTNVLEAPPAAAPEGIILPPTRKVVDTSGRVFLFFVDDLHMQFQNSGRVRELFKKIENNLVHEADLFGTVSSGPSWIAQDMTYDRKRFDEAIKKSAGSGLKPSEIIQRGSGSEGVTELRYNAHVS